jgi:hypothetical protein
MITLAFYRGKSHPIDIIVQTWTRSPYSHVELVEQVMHGAGTKEIAAFNGLSASPRDNGVRETWILVKPGHWDFITVPGDPVAAAAFIRRRVGAPYDWLKLWAAHVFGIHNVQTPRAYLCSEIIAQAIGCAYLASHHPGGLHRALAGTPPINLVQKRQVLNDP